LRITPSPYHDDALMDDLVAALTETWRALGIGARNGMAAE
jgi:5-aminolevulinate synthase